MMVTQLQEAVKHEACARNGEVLALVLQYTSCHCKKIILLYKLWESLKAKVVCYCPDNECLWQNPDPWDTATPCVARRKREIREEADKLYNELLEMGSRDPDNCCLQRLGCDSQVTNMLTAYEDGCD